jgi:hypothetical protein
MVSGWLSDPEERRREMARRRKVAARNKAHQEPIETNPHKNEKFRATMRKTAKKIWANMTPEQRQIRLASMQAGRGAKPNGVAA